MHPNVDEFLAKTTQWREELEQLRKLLLECQLTEEWKWRQPCYTYRGKNVMIIGGFKAYCALMFFKGSLLRDTHNLLITPGEHTQAGRQIRFTCVEDIIGLRPILKAYVFEAIEVEKAGLKVDYKKTSQYTIPEELQYKFEELPDLKTAFEALTPGRQRAYLLYFSDAKQSSTRASRIDKYMLHILKGKGLGDQ